MKAGWTEVALGEVATIDRELVQPDAIPPGTMYVALENVIPGGGLRNVRQVASGELTSAKFAFTRDHVLFGKLRPNLAKSARPCFAGICSTDILPIRPTAFLDRDYLAHFIAFPRTVALASQRAAGANLPRLSPAELQRFRIPLPPIHEQIKIARVLDAAASLRMARRRSINAASALSQSMYREMFGRPTNARTVSLDEVADVASGITKGRRLSTQAVAEVPYLAVSNVQDGRLDMTAVRRIAATQAEIDRYRLRLGDLLLTEGGDPDKLGRGALWGGEIDPCLHQNHVFRVRIRDRNVVNPAFLCAQVAAPPARSYFLRAAKQTTGIASISRTQLGGLPVQIPSIESQRLFAERLHAGDRVDEARCHHLQRLNVLFTSLQYRAFAGEL